MYGCRGGECLSRKCVDTWIDARVNGQIDTWGQTDECEMGK